MPPIHARAPGPPASRSVEFSYICSRSVWQSARLFLNTLDTFCRLRSLVEFYVTEHNSTIPHSAFRGQTPDEMYFDKGTNVPDDLARQRSFARRDRIEANRARRCATCA